MTRPEQQELLEMRLVALRQDLAKVQKVAGAAGRRSESLGRLQGLIGTYDSKSLFQRLSRAQGLFGMIMNSIRGDRELFDRIEEHGLAAEVEELETLLPDAFQALTMARKELDDNAHLLVKVDPDMTRSLVRRCRTESDLVKDLLEQLKDGTLGPAEVWERYEKLLDNGCKELFADYVDFLGGLTLRDNALDDEVCAITDSLLREIPGNPKLLALPARRPTLSSAFTELVKLGFPDWTIWNIPLVGAEIGKSYVERYGIGDRFAGLLGENAEDAPVLFADAYAAYTIGPAYGCATTLLKFQPDHEAEHYRAAVILGVLEQLAQTATGFGDVVDRAKEYWQEALVRLNDNADPDLALGTVRPFVSAVCEELAEDDMVESFKPVRWDQVTEIRDELGSETVIGYRPPTGLSALVLLNAAWATWLDNPGDEDWAKRVTDNVKTIWRAVSDRHVPRGGRYGQA
ncbi:hypothetical protein [Amycolatopsis minnesotensis]|uniref:Uncharacterized protein n=1 Tax=Amycolatopsis minnesotensis TaxID=337894 RepID=A0ABN2R7T4_9PSEU